MYYSSNTTTRRLPKGGMALTVPTVVNGSLRTEVCKLCNAFGVVRIAATGSLLDNLEEALSKSSMSLYQTVTNISNGECPLKQCPNFRNSAKLLKMKDSK